MCCLCLLFVSALFVSAVVDVCLFLFSVIVRAIVCQLVPLGSLMKRGELVWFPRRAEWESFGVAVCMFEAGDKKKEWESFGVVGNGPRDNDKWATCTRAQGEP